MGKGIAKRRRKRRAEKANESNLAKASYGKALAGAALPQAPKDEEFKEKVSASLRRLMKLKEVAIKEDARKKARMEAQQYKKSQGQDRQQDQHDLQAQQDGQPATSQQKQAKSDNSTERQKTQKKKTHTTQPDEPVYIEGAFGQTQKKKLKERKKEFLERKKLFKKKGRQADPDMVPAELRLKEKQIATQAKFGEVADAPLKVQLKRKHWVTKQSVPENPLDTTDTPSRATSERMKKIFMSQMATAQQRMSTASGAPAQGGGAAAPNHAGPNKRRKHAGDTAVVPKGGLLQQARQQAAARTAALEREKLRHDVISAYRNSKKGAAASGGASMASLAKLVQKNAIAAAAQQAQLR